MDQCEEVVELPGKRLTIAYKANPKSKKKLIVFLHGLGGNMHQFYKQFEECSTYSSVLAIDYIGHGKSGNTSSDADYKTESIIADVMFILKLFADRHNELLFV
jgi:pimeloyl-ACP methyl ester carboxylesterase